VTANDAHAPTTSQAIAFNRLTIHGHRVPLICSTDEAQRKKSQALFAPQVQALVLGPLAHYFTALERIVVVQIFEDSILPCRFVQVLIIV